MYRLTEDQLDYLQEDIREGGVYDPELQEDLMDHLCCHIEKGLEEGRDFEAAYAIARQVVCPEGLKQIQRETARMSRSKRQKTLRAALFGTGFIATFTIMIATLFKILHWPMGDPMVLFGWGLLFAGFIPAFISYKMTEERPKSRFEKMTYVIGSVFTAVLSTGIFFKFMHWPGANEMNVLGSFGFCLFFLPLLFVLLYRQSAKMA